MQSLTDLWNRITGTSQTPVAETPAGMTTDIADGAVGGRKRKSKKTRRGGKKSRKSKPSRK